MLATTLFAGLLTTYQSGALDFLKDLGLDTAKEIAKDTLKSLGEKVVGYFKGKKEEDTFDALENAVTKQNAEKFKTKSDEVLALLKSAVETDAGFRKEVESILNGLSDDKKQALEKQASIVVQNSTNVVAGSTFGDISGGFRIGDDYKKD